MKSKNTVAMTKKAPVAKTSKPPRVPKKLKVKFEQVESAVPVPVPPQPAISFEEDVLRILRANPEWSNEIKRLPTEELVLMGVRDVTSSSEHLIMTPFLVPRKKDMNQEELTSLDAMRARRTAVIDRVHTLVNTRLRRGFTCQDEDWFALVRNMVVVAVVGAEGMRGPFEFRSWMINVARTEKILDMGFVRSKNISEADFKLMLASCLFAFVLACRYVHLSVRESDVIPSLQRGNLLHIMRVLFGTFWSSAENKRDTDVLTLASMMLASTMTEKALVHLPAFLAEMNVPQAEWPWFILNGHFPGDMYKHIDPSN